MLRSPFWYYRVWEGKTVNDGEDTDHLAILDKWAMVDTNAMCVVVANHDNNGGETCICGHYDAVSRAKIKLSFCNKNLDILLGKDDTSFSGDDDAFLASTLETWHAAIVTIFQHEVRCLPRQRNDSTWTKHGYHQVLPVLMLPKTLNYITNHLSDEKKKPEFIFNSFCFTEQWIVQDVSQIEKDGSVAEMLRKEPSRAGKVLKSLSSALNHGLLGASATVTHEKIVLLDNIIDKCPQEYKESIFHMDFEPGTVSDFLPGTVIFPLQQPLNLHLLPKNREEHNSYHNVVCIPGHVSLLHPHCYHRSGNQVVTRRPGNASSRFAQSPRLHFQYMDANYAANKKYKQQHYVYANRPKNKGWKNVREIPPCVRQPLSSFGSLENNLSSYNQLFQDVDWLNEYAFHPDDCLANQYIRQLVQEHKTTTASGEPK